GRGRRRLRLVPGLAGPGAQAREVGLPELLVLDPIDPPAALDDLGGVPDRHRLEQPPQGGAVQILRVTLVVPVLAGEAPVALAQRDAAVRAAVLHPEDLALVADQEEVLAEQAHLVRLLADLVDEADRVPVAAEAGVGRLVVRPARPVLAAREPAGPVPLGR